MLGVACWMLIEIRNGGGRVKMRKKKKSVCMNR